MHGIEDEEEEEEEEEGGDGDEDVQPAPPPFSSDFRAEQCANLFQLVSLGAALAETAQRGEATTTHAPSPATAAPPQRDLQRWFPYEHHSQELKCKLNCYSRETGEYYQERTNDIYFRNYEM